ncbi:MogA/MoaB family molybdenum cofactor biosynthesis protein [Rhodopirellula halodulae]|uniref:MogA/MoaB family molybdenum cofactor biosynthesis protein n=1 Tax=Rhodopirellula halodulae TaxID=2894198 RepID=UPI001E3314A9|nr:MogA/MoaB family molybdenum cofactor biosynthesis protein [Rhodopirellula sp. JC737]MCC9657417.1 MogA/MoaB family molybdenum cofactor biosynthesis protein [Rhodopirellula sp. JC737]
MADSTQCGCPDVDAEKCVRVAVITLSDTRGKAEDRSGDRVASLLEEAGHVVANRFWLTDDLDGLKDCLRQLKSDETVESIVTTGGTGIAPRDLAIEAIESMLDVSLPGFGETFRSISYAEIGPKAMLSRATAGRMGTKVLFALPGSTGAVTTGMTQCVLPILRHAVSLATR